MGQSLQTTKTSQDNSWEEKKERLLSMSDAAEFVGISTDTLRRWENRGRIEAHRSPGGHRYFDKEDLRELFGKKYTRIEEETEKKDKEEKKTEEKEHEENKVSEIDSKADEKKSMDDAKKDKKVDDEISNANGERKSEVSKVIVPPTTPVRIIGRQISSMRELDIEYTSYDFSNPKESQEVTESTENLEEVVTQKSVLEPKTKDAEIQKITPIEKGNEEVNTQSQKVTKIRKDKKGKTSIFTYIKITTIILITILTLAFAIYSLVRIRGSTPIVSPVP